MKNLCQKLKITFNKLIIFSAIAFTAIVLALALIWFKSNINDMLSSTTAKYMTVNAEALAAVFNAKLDDQFIMLESQTRYFSNVDMSRYNDMKSTIMATKGIGAFKTIGVASSSGSTLNYNGKSSGNILLTDYFAQAMSGENAISLKPTIDEEGAQVITLAVPIPSNDSHNTIKGVIFGTFDETMLSTLVNTTSFDGNGENLLLATDGTIMARTSGLEHVSSTLDNFFDVIGSDNIPHNGESKNFKYTNGKYTSIVAITPVGVHDWYFATIVPETIIDQQSSQISTYMLIVIIAIVIAFMILIFTLIQIMRDNDLMVRKNERFQLASEQSQDIIFDYDYSKQLLTLDGYTNNLIADGQNKFHYDDFLMLIDLIHPDDRKFFEEILSLPETGQTSVAYEFRLFCLDNKYYWYRLKASLVTSSDNKPVQLVGSIVNVDEQMAKEKNLIEKAETDSLTGILNKGAFQNKVASALEASTDEDMYALYIIDLDNFKAVNDTLGHSMGDQVLSDVAKKLCIIFSEHDNVGRIGGDEFAAFLKLSGDGRKKASNIINAKGKAICVSLKETYQTQDNRVNVSASVGVAIFPNGGSDYTSLYKNADSALYQVKSNGKNQYNIYTPSMRIN